jgi:hypothetical protein
MAPKVGAARLTKIRGVDGLAKYPVPCVGDFEAQPIEYKGFDREKARELPAQPSSVLKIEVHGVNPILSNPLKNNELLAESNLLGGV